MQENIFRWFALIAFLTYWFTVGFLLIHWPRNRQKSLSDHIAAGKKQITLLIIVVAVETSLYALFLYKWFIPTFSMPNLFTWMITLALITHLATFVFPSTKGRVKRIHWLASYMTALFFIPIALLLITQSSIPLAGRLAVAVSLIAMVGISVGLYATSIFRKQPLIVHCTYIFSLQIAVVFISLLKI